MESVFKLQPSVSASPMAGAVRHVKAHIYVIFELL